MIGKLKKLKKVIHSKGIQLRKPSHWVKLIKQGFYFFRRNGLNSIGVLRNRYNHMSNVNVNSPQTHAQIWERIKPTHIELTKMRWAIPNLKRHYSFTVVVEREDLDTVASVEKQIYDKFEILIGAPRETLKNATGDYVMFLQAGDYLHRNALFEMVVELNRIGKTPSVLYFDHDYFVRGVADKPYYKPGWSPDLLLVNNYINRACLFRRDLLKQIEIEDTAFYAAIYDITLKLAEFEAGHHRPGILLTLPNADDERAHDPLENTVRDTAIKRRGINGVIERNKYGVASLKRQVQGNPKVSIIIPTCYAKTFVEDCLKSIERVSTYKNYEVIVVDYSRKAQGYGQDRLKGYNCRILYIHEPCNWSRLINLGAKEATGDVLLFLSDDTKILTPDWLERMAAEAQRPEIGMVGPLVLRPGGEVYSAGVFMASHGNAAYHSFMRESENSTTYHNLLHYSRESSSFVGACFAIEKSKLNKIDGFDESLPVACNGPAMTCEMRGYGYSHRYIAEVQIVYYENDSRKSEEKREDNISFLRSDEIHKRDVLLNPYLDQYKSDYTEDTAPTVFRLTGTPTMSHNGIQKIIMVKLDHIGDVILSIPAIRKIRKVFPNARIDVLCGTWAKGLLEQQPEINNVYTFNFFNEQSGNPKISMTRDAELSKVINELKKNQYDLSINLRRHTETRQIARKLADFTLEFSENAEDEQISHPVPAIGCFASKTSKWSISDQMLSLAQNLDYDETLNREIVIPADVQRKVDDYVHDNPFLKSDILIGIHIGCGSPSRSWPIEGFAQLCDLIITRLNARIILLGGKAEIEDNKKIMEQLRYSDSVLSVAGMFSLLEYCQLVKKMDYYIGNNSGPAHIAGIQGVSTLVIWHGEASAEEWSPIGKSMIVERSAICKPCYGTCPDRECLAKIQPVDVYDGLLRLMTLFPSSINR